jgi:hypothetical protein
VRPALRLAASVLIGVGIGHAAGRWVRSASPGGPEAGGVSQEQAAADALHLRVLGTDSSPGIAGLVLGGNGNGNGGSE